jgi:methylated-DNA-[protein]-cysteine S-methyltransferase
MSERRSPPASSRHVAQTALGPVALTAVAGAITALDILPAGTATSPGPAPPLLSTAFAQLRQYLDGGRQAFDLPLAPAGTTFQRKVWTLLTQIPHGTTATYGDIAAQAGQPGAARAVGGACHHNPIPVFIPCHRVVAAGGKLGGFGLGLPLKQRLLKLEQGLGLGQGPVKPGTRFTASECDTAGDDQRPPSEQRGTPAGKFQATPQTG